MYVIQIPFCILRTTAERVWKRKTNSHGIVYVKQQLFKIIITVVLVVLLSKVIIEN